MAKFKIGQIVTCVDATGFTRKFNEKVPVQGGHYMVRSVIGNGPAPCIRLLSIVNSRQLYDDGVSECAFRPTRFVLGAH